MTDEYIRREDALKGKKTGTFANGICLVVEPCVTVEYIESLEPADVVPVVHGRWKKKKDSGLFYCSECELPSMHKWPYCERCGAKMDGERKE